MKGLLKGLAHMHNKNIIHRDIKPENCIFKDKNDLNSLKIVDFGLSKQLSALKVKEIFMGTVPYMAPE